MSLVHNISKSVRTISHVDPPNDDVSLSPAHLDLSMQGNKFILLDDILFNDTQCLDVYTESCFCDVVVSTLCRALGSPRLLFVNVR